MRNWIQAELLAAGLDRRRAASIADASTGYVAAATAVAVARAVQELPEGPAWWDLQHRRVVVAVTAMQQGNPDEAYVLLGERLAPDAPDAWDSNWPEDKVWRVVEVPVGLGAGDRFLIGDGMGLRAEAEVSKRGGEGGVVIVAGSVRHGLDPWYEPALEHAERLAAESMD